MSNKHQKKPGSSIRTHTKRIMKDLCEFYKEDPKNLFIVPEDDMTVIHALIIGTENTPYENGFFYFVLRFPDDYPLQPPNVKLMTTGTNTVRFNPNLYSNGKVCLSILGTWAGPAWSAAQTVFSTLLSIQSLMNENPYHNEPGFEQGTKKNTRSTDRKDDVNNYNEMIIHETLRVAVIQMLEGTSRDARAMPSALREKMVSHFKNNFDFYENKVRLKQRLDGKDIIDPFKDPQRPKVFEYKQLLPKILALKKKYENVVECDNLVNPNDNLLEPKTEAYDEIAKRIMSSKGNKPTETTNESSSGVDDEMYESVVLDSYSEDES